jgi:hypothetical protein
MGGIFLIEVNISLNIYDKFGKFEFIHLLKCPNCPKGFYSNVPIPSVLSIFGKENSKRTFYYWRNEFQKCLFLKAIAFLHGSGPSPHNMIM